MPLVAGVDSSTQSTKVELRDPESGELVGTGRAPHPSVAPPVSEQDPATWLEAFHSALDMALREAGARTGSLLGKESLAAISVISVAAQQHGMVVLGHDGTVLRPAKLWNDTESAPDALALRKLLPGGDAAWAAACGSVPVAALTVAKLAWLKRREPETFKHMARIMLPHDWITYQLTGRSVTDRGDASGTGYWSPGEGHWRLDLLALVDSELDWEPLLPTVLRPTEPAGEWGRIAIGPGTGDNMASALGIGLKPGDTAISLGTSGTAFMVSAGATADASGYVEGFADASGRFLPLVCTLNATLVTDTVARLLNIDRDELARLALDEPPGAGGLVLVPYLSGERTPDRPYARGGIAGIHTGATTGSLVRSAFEGVVCSMLDAADHLHSAVSVKDAGALSVAGQQEPGQERSAQPGRLFLVGGGARSGAYQQILADLSGTRVIVPEVKESVATGACVQAAAVARGCSVDQVMEEWNLDAGQVVEPRDIAQRSEIRQRYASIAASTIWDGQSQVVAG